MAFWLCPGLSVYVRILKQARKVQSMHIGIVQYTRSAFSITLSVNWLCSAQQHYGSGLLAEE